MTATKPTPDIGPRGLYKTVQHIDGSHYEAYFALDRLGRDASDGLWVVWPGEDEDEIIVRLRRQLDYRDPIWPRLRLVGSQDFPEVTCASGRPDRSLSA